MVWHLRQFPWLVPAAVSALVLISFGDKACVASDFQNLDFESAAIGTASYQVPASQGLPYWTTNSYHQGYVDYNNIAMDSPCVSVHDAGSGYLVPFQGHYSVLLQTGSPFYYPPNQPVFVSQVGDVPPDARSIQFDTDYCWGGDMSVSLNGTLIPISPYLTSTSLAGNVETFIGDVSAFAGQQNVELKFQLSEVPGWYTTFGAQQSLDNIVFSDSVVPEPSSLILFVAGVVTACVYPFRRQCRVEK